MAGMKKGRAGSSSPPRDVLLRTHPVDLRSLLLDAEPDLAALAGVVAALQLFAEASDHVDPRAIAILARAGDDALERVQAVWHAVTQAPVD